MTARFVVVVAVLWLAWSASPVSAQPLPSDAVPVELIAGTLGGATLGIGGFLVAFSTCAADVEDVEGWGAIGAAIACAAFGVLGYAIGVPVGATAGVNLAGSLSGVQGNFLLSALGAVGGDIVGLGLSGLVASMSEEMPDALAALLVLGVVPLSSSAGATLGYNVGARMKSDTPTDETLALRTGGRHADSLGLVGSSDSRSRRSWYVRRAAFRVSRESRAHLVRFWTISRPKISVSSSWLSASSSSMLRPSTVSDRISAEAWLMVQPSPSNEICFSMSPSNFRWRRRVSPQPGLPPSASTSASSSARQ